MIPNSTIIAFFIAAFFTLLVPILVLIVLLIKRRISIIPLLVGACAFFISQIVLRLPLISVLSLNSWYIQFTQNHFMLYGFILSLSAGIFEESARLIGAKILKSKRTFKDVISFGLGHGICEVIILVGLTNVSNISLSLLINNGMAATVLPVDMIDTVTSQLMSVTSTYIVWGILERISAVSFHIFATVLIFKGVVKKKILYFPLAILCHCLFNFIALLFVQYSNIMVTELALLLLGALGIWYTVNSKNDFPIEQPNLSI